MTNEADAPRVPRVMIDAYNLDLPHGTGVATYARNLSYALHALGYGVEVLHGRRAAGPADPLLREVTFFDTALPPPPAWRRALTQAREWLGGPLLARSTAKPVDLADRVISADLRRRMAHHDRLWNVADLYGRAQRQYTSWRLVHRLQLPDPPAVMHWTYPLPIRANGTRNLYTLHDLVPLRLPYTTLDRKRRYLQLMRYVAASADHLVTVSECSRRDIINLLGIAPERVTNTYQSVSLPEHLTAKPWEQVGHELASTFRLKPRGYYLYVGAIEPKKNVARLIEAYLATGSEAPLVLAGPKAWKSAQELRLYLGNERRLHHRVQLLDYVPQSVLVNLIRGARALVFPSIYEGFGLPVLEAMLLGTPVISSNTGSIPEVAGEAAVLVDPYNTQALAEAIRGLDGNPALLAELAARGPRQAELFSPARYRQRLDALYARLLAVPPRAG